MGGLAMDLKAQGWTVTGTDAVAFPPMSDLLEAHGIAFECGKGPFTVPAGAEMVVSGSAAVAEAAGTAAAAARGVPVMHLPAFLRAHCFGSSRRFVVAGTNGKTTTSAMLAWILEQAGLAPDYLIGAACREFAGPVRMRGARWMVLEGDEYFADLLERIPKFHFYDPQVLLLTNIAYDHAEVYPNETAVREEFTKLIARLPPEGLLVAADSPAVNELAAAAPCRVLRAGWTRECAVRISPLRATGQGMAFSINGTPVLLQIPGRMNALNAALALTAAGECGVSPQEAAGALATFSGVPGRCEVRHDTRELTVINDDGYHPMSLRECLAALRLRYPGRRLVTVLQARYTGGRGGYQHRALPEVLAAADAVILTPVFDYAEFPGGPLTTRTLAAALRRKGISVHVLSKSRRLPAFYRRMHQPGDVLFCSLAMRQDAVITALLETAASLSPA